jgi:GNAT superfamily N-acetyltransferase
MGVRWVSKFCKFLLPLHSVAWKLQANPIPRIAPTLWVMLKKYDIKMPSEFQLKTSPTQFDLKKIEEWLVQEDREFNEGFYCNWTIIKNAFIDKRFVTLDFNESPIGFLVWSIGTIHVEIDILEIKPDYRKKGIGHTFLEKISEYFKLKGFLAIKLFCSPIESERFWKKIGFIRFPELEYSESELTYFKPLIEIQQTSTNRETDNKVELWDVEPYQKSNNPPKWTWNIEIRNDKLILPIIHPCNCNWNLRWVKNGKIIKENKVKYFNSKENSVEFSPFLYIEKLIE